MIVRLLALWNSSMPLRFLFVGGWNFVFGYLAFVGSYWLLKSVLSDWLIVLISYVLGITNSFITHRWLTYRSHGCWWWEYIRFYVVYGGQLVLNVVLIAVFVTWLSWNAYLTQLGITLFLTFASYWGHKIYSFKENHD